MKIFISNFYLSILIGLIFFSIVFAHIYAGQWIVENVTIGWFLLFAGLAGTMDAVKDTLAHHFHISIFKKLDRTRWDALVSWQGRKYFGMRCDAWHGAKMLHTLFMCIAIVRSVEDSVNIYADFAIIYICYKAMFNIFYSYLLIRR